MACSCKKSSTSSANKVVKQVVKRLPSSGSTAKPSEIRKRIIKKISYRRPI